LPPKFLERDEEKKKKIFNRKPISTKKNLKKLILPSS